VIAFALGILAAGGWATADQARIAKGNEIYQTACLLCHGRDGGGNPDWESAVRPVAFSDCGTTAEATEQWRTIVKRGGPARGLSSVMPAFGEAYSDEEIAAVVAYIRTFCARADAYPPGDLNFRRPLATGKAFPEAEVVLSASHRPPRGSRETELELQYENRLGPRFQYELVLPLRAQASAGEGRGIGDVEIEGKHVLHFDLRRLEIVSAGLGVTLPTGSESKGLSDGTASFAPFVAYGKGWRQTFLQGKLEAELPADRDKSDRRILYALALSRALGPPRVAWTPAVELTGAWNSRTRSHEYAVWAEVSKPLNRLGHVIGSLGVQVPVRPAGERYRIEAFLLWDFGDGPLWVGW
jgi:mono/diheme cytochrome c family protein